MDYENFVEQIAGLVRQAACGKLSENTDVTVKKVIKNNHTVQVALCILEPGSNITPTIYLESYFKRWQAGEGLSSLAGELVEEYRANSRCRFLQMDFLSHWETVREYTACKLIHAKSNRELLEDLPHRRFLDCAIVYYLELSDPMIGEGIALIHNRNLEVWQITEKELYQQAYLNTEIRHGCRIRSLNQVMREIVYQKLHELTDSGVPEDGQEHEEMAEMAEMGQIVDRLQEELCCPEQELMYLMTNRDQYFGAVTLIYQKYLQGFADRYPEGFYVIPSSIHEVLLVPARASVSQEELQSMLHDVNEELMQEEPESFLSDRVYYYDPKKAVLNCPWASQNDFTEFSEFGG